MSYPDDCETLAEDMMLVKILFNSVVSTLGAKFMCIDQKFLPKFSTEEIQVPPDQIGRYSGGNHPKVQLV